MIQLIWFSIPGGIVISAFIIAGAWPDVTYSGVSILTTGSVPIVGFIIHQAFRCIFEKWFGFDWKKRRVLSEIKKRFDSPERMLETRECFLIWEATFYATDFPESFREHDRGAWHYILSFWTSGIAAFLASIPLLFHSVLEGITFILVSVVFVIKGYLTWNSLCDQEVQIFKRYCHLFEENRDALVDSSYVPKEIRANITEPDASH